MTEAYSADDWIKERRALSVKPYTLPSKEEIIDRVSSSIFKPDSKLATAFLPEITKHAEETLDAVRITNMIIDGYNTASEKLNPEESGTLLILLGSVTESIVSDMEIRRMVNHNIFDSMEKMREKAS